MDFIGRTVQSDSGSEYEVTGELNCGGQAVVYRAEEQSTGQCVAVKFFHEKFAGSDTHRRIGFLVAQNLNSVCDVLLPPTETIGSEGVGHVAPMAAGQSLAKLLDPANAPINFLEALQLALALTHAIECLHVRGLAHGDLHADNIIANRRCDGVIEVRIIDFDNFYAPGAPLPHMLGQLLYIAPELRDALESKSAVIPDIRADRFSLAILLHEILLLRHPAAGATTDEDFYKRMMVWSDDPALARGARNDPGGHPVQVLNSDLCRLFRNSVSRDPDERPGASDWKRALQSACTSANTCEQCGTASLIDVSKTACPACKAPWPQLELVLEATGVVIKIDQGMVAVGRNTVGGSFPKMSGHHCVFRRIGPDVRIESFGRNGTARWNGAKWVPLPTNRELLIQAGDRLRLADCEITVRQA